MKKKLIITLSVLIVLIISAYEFVPYIVLNMITDYEPYSFEKVFDDSQLREHYGIFNNRTPGDYGYKNFDIIDFQSLDGTNLNGWYVPSENETQNCLVLVHGRTSNRLKTMKYLALIDSLQLDTLYNIFIPDLRNSGKSEPAKTFMGYKFGEDLTASILLMDSVFNQQNFILYGFSMGSMAILNTIGRKELRNRLDKKNIRINKIILDSPLSNVKATLKVETSNAHVPQFIFSKVFKLYSDQINGFGESMKISSLLDANIPTLILESKDDDTTPAAILLSELSQMKEYANIDLEIFEGPGHVKLYQDERTNLRYINSVRAFLAK